MQILLSKYIFWILLDFLFSSHHWWIGDVLFIALYNYRVLFNAMTFILEKKYISFPTMCIKSSFVRKKNLLSCAVQSFGQSNWNNEPMWQLCAAMGSWVGCLLKD